MHFAELAAANLMRYDGICLRAIFVRIAAALSSHPVDGQTSSQISLKSESDWGPAVNMRARE